MTDITADTQNKSFKVLIKWMVTTKYARHVCMPTFTTDPLIIYISVATAEFYTFAISHNERSPILLEFAKDTVVAIGKTAVITNPGHASKVLLSLRSGMTVVDMWDEDGLLLLNDDNNSTGTAAAVICNGGGVMFTGWHFLFVGISERTNMAAVDVLENAFDFSENAKADGALTCCQRTFNILRA
jgi:hypothetical protein